jgi:hypothetical protein
MSDGASGFALPQILANDRQHRSIRDLEQEDASGESVESPVLAQIENALDATRKC